LRVTLKDGEVLRHREPVNRGHAERPLSNAEIQRKYADNAALHFASGHAPQVQQQLLSLPQLAACRRWRRCWPRTP
jgi:hypothetical protein